MKHLIGKQQRKLLIFPGQKKHFCREDCELCKKVKPNFGQVNNLIYLPDITLVKLVFFPDMIFNILAKYLFDLSRRLKKFKKIRLRSKLLLGLI